MARTTRRAARAGRTDLRNMVRLLETLNEAPEGPGLLHPLQPHFLDVGQRGAIDRSVFRLQGDGVRVRAADDVGRRRLLAVLQDGGRLDDPLVALLGPGALAEGARVVEAPRADP